MPQTIKADQIRAARALTGWSQSDLAENAGLSVPGIANIETGKQRPSEQTITKIVAAFETVGVEFIDGGVRHSQNIVRVFEGIDCYLRLLDDVFYSLKAGDELLIACADDKVSPPTVNDNYRRIRNAGIKMRQLVEKGNTYLMGDTSEYRYLPKKFFHNNVFVVYGDKIGSVLQNERKIMIIQDRGLAESLRNIFNFTWSITEKPLESTSHEKF